MFLEAQQAFELVAAILAAAVIFVIANSTPLKVSVGFLLVLIPFQPVATIYGTANIGMTYVLFAALLIRGRLTYAPMLGAMLAVVFAYLISISQLPKMLYILHGAEVILLVSSFLVLILTYNLAREVENPKFIINLLIFMNVLCVLYCFVQLAVGPGQSFSLFGIDALSMNRNRGGEERLVGPFGTAGLTAAYFMSMTLILMYEAFNSQKKRRNSVLLLATLNVAMIIATANRGSFIVLISGTLLLLHAFRKELGYRRVSQALAVSTIIIVVSGAAVITYTDFGLMFSRLQSTTELEDGVPATRAYLWPRAWEDIKEKPILGHGPKLLGPNDRIFRRPPPEQLVSPYPHSLYLHLLVTVGIIGTVCMLYFLFSVAWRVYKAAKRHRLSSTNAPVSAYEKGWLVVGTIVVVTFLVDELKIEFLRSATTDYAHFMFALFGVFLGWADSAEAKSRATEIVRTKEVSKNIPFKDDYTVGARNARQRQI
jgi:O-antigen ligase